MCYKKTSSRHNIAVALMNLLQQWLTAQDLHKIRLVNISSWMREEAPRGPTPPGGTIANACWGTGVSFFKGVVADKLPLIH